MLRAFGLRASKRFGQHFLVSRKVLDRLLGEADLRPGERVLEIGAGLGTLTVALAVAGAEVIAVEVDARLIPVLRATTARYPSVRLVHADVMRQDLPALAGPGPLKVVANLPYNIASPLLVRLLETLPGLRRVVVTVQREVAERISATPGRKAYGALTVLIQYRTEARLVMRVPPGAFLPPPEVDSAVLRLVARDRPAVAVDDEAFFFAVVRAAFAHRRKVLRTVLTAVRPGLTPPQVEAACRRAGIDPRRRGETLSLEEFATLTRALA